MRAQISALRAAGGAAFQRRGLVLAGPPEWGRTAAATLPDATDAVLWLGAEADAPTGARVRSARRAREVLGEEYDLVCLDLHTGLDPDALGATAGTVRAGGLLVLLVPALERWPHRVDPSAARLAVEPFAPDAVGRRLARRMARLVVDRPGIAVVTPAGVVYGGALVAPDRSPPSAPGPCRTADQAEAVAAVVKVATGRRRRPLVLTADRGRGKSSALGIAAGRLLAERPISIVVTAPGPRAVAPVFERAAAALGLGAGAHRLEAPNGGRLVFRAPGELLSEPIAADVLLVDEAATLPVPVLERLLGAHARVVFSTTVHGYEGTGRGFALRFCDVLDARAPGWRAARLTAPIRWSEGDPVEAFVFRALCLDADAAPDAAVAGATPEACEAVRLDRDALAADDAALDAVFGLLVNAHYRTTPGDLHRLLDAPNMAVWALRWRGQVVGAALVAHEGGLSPALSAAIYEGRRRPPGHLIPETLACHAGLEGAPLLRGARVVRIAIHPAVRARGLGGRLLGAVVEGAREAGLDYVGSVFGATPRLLRFWRTHGLEVARMGVRRGKSSGACSAVVLRPLTPAGAALAEAARGRAADELPHALGDGLRDLEPALAVALLRAVGGAPVPAEADLVHAAACAAGARGHDVVVAPIWRVVRWALCLDALHPGDAAVLLRRALQRWTWLELAASLGRPGRGPAMAAFQAALGRALTLGVGDPLPPALARFGRPHDRSTPP